MQNFHICRKEKVYRIQSSVHDRFIRTHKSSTAEIQIFSQKKCCSISKQLPPSYLEIQFFLKFNFSLKSLVKNSKIDIIININKR